MDKNLTKKIPANFISKIIRNKTTHFLVQGDSVNITQKIPDGSIDLIFTDPPYNANINYGKYYKDNLDWKEYYSLAKKWFKEYERILKPTGSFYLVNYPEINARLLPYIEDELGLKLRRWITWTAPTNIGHSKKNYTRTQRSILFFTKSDDYVFNKSKIIQPYKNENVGKIKDRIKKGFKGRGAYDTLSFLDLIEMNLIENNKNPADIIEINLLKNISKDRLNKQHPCQLPFELIRRFIEVSTNPGDTVLDPFAGTFSTSSVSSSLKRNSIGIELNPRFIKLGLRRMK